MRKLVSALAALVAITTVPSSSLAVAFSRDGRMVAFVRQGTACVCGADGKGARAVGPAAPDQTPAWSPNGRYVAFVGGTDGTRLDLYDVQTGRTRDLGSGYMSPIAWREDSRRLVAIRQPDPNGPFQAAWYNLPESGLSLHVNLPSRPVGDWMVYLPNTDDIAFVAGDGAARDVYMAEVGEVSKITKTGDVIGFGISRSGKRLIWARSSKNTRYILLSVYAFDLTQRNVARVGFPDRVAGINPNPHAAPLSVETVWFSADGSRMALTARMAGSSTKAKPTTALFTVRMDGAGARLVGRYPDGSALAADLSPDGARIACAVTGPSTNGLWIANSDGSAPVDVFGR